MIPTKAFTSLLEISVFVGKEEGHMKNMQKTYKLFTQ